MPPQIARYPRDCLPFVLLRADTLATMSSAPGFQYSVNVDTERNVVYLTQAGVAQKEDMDKMLAAYEEALKEARPGFILVNDQRKVRDFSDEAMAVGVKMVNRTAERGVAHVIRLKPETLGMGVRISRVLITARATYQTELVTRPEEAEERIKAFLARSGDPR